MRCEWAISPRLRGWADTTLHVADDMEAIERLREAKHRDEKPFAVMVASLKAAERICDIGDEERALLVSARRPIVLLRKWNVAELARIAPGNPYLGVFLPYTPLHHLLLRRWAVCR